MIEETCAACGTKSEFDPEPGARCFACSAAFPPPTLCYECHQRVPSGGACPYCRAQTVSRDDYELAAVLRSHGVPVAEIPDRVRTADREKLLTEYRSTWLEIETEMHDLERLFRSRLPPSQVAGILSAIDQARRYEGATPDGFRPVLRQWRESVEEKPPVAAPWPLGVCKAIAEAAPWRLDKGRYARKSGPYLPRGLDDSDRETLLRLAEGHGGTDPGDAVYGAAAAYGGHLSASRLLCLGEVPSRQDRRPMFDLHEASRRAARPKNGIPVAMIRGRGIFWATGRAPSADVYERWTPTGFFYGTTPLHELEGLRAFLRDERPPITPSTLAHLIHWLLAPFPWDTRVSGFPEEWRDLEQKLEDSEQRGRSAAALIGGVKPPPTAQREELTLRLEPQGTTLAYRPGVLEVR